MPHGAPVVLQRKGDIGTRQRDALEGFFAPGEFGGLGFEEFAPCGRIEIQLAYLHRGALRLVGRCGFAESPVNSIHFPAMGICSGSAGQCELCDRRDARQRFAAKAHAGYPLQIFQRGDLAGGVAHQRQRQLVPGDATAVVAHAQQLDSAALQLHRNVGRTCIQAVLQQFLERGSGALDHLASGDLIDEQVGQQADGGHGCKKI